MNDAKDEVRDDAGDVVCALDVGTTGVRTGAVDKMGQLCYAAYADYSVSYPAVGRAEQDPWELWLGARTTLRSVVEQAAADGRRVRAVVVAAQRASVAGIGAEDTPTTPFLLWMDQRGGDELEVLRSGNGEAAFRATTGLPLNPMISLAKILWLRRHESVAFAATSRFVGVQEWILGRLGCPDPATDRSCASWVGLYDLTHGCWDQWLLTATGLPRSLFSRVISATDAAGEVSQEAAEATGLAPGTLIFAGGGDQQCSSVGAGGVSPDAPTLNLGTSAVLMVPLAQELRDEKAGFVTAAHVIDSMTEIEGTVPACGSVLRWLAEVLGYADHADPYATMMAAAEAAAPGSNGLAFLPTLAGLGTPHWRPRTGTMTGLTLAHSRGELVRAALEGTAYQVRDMLVRAAELGLTPHAARPEIRMLGGGARSLFSCQLLADVLRCDLVVPTGDPQSAPLRGAAACAWVGLGVHSGMSEAAAAMAPVERIHHPDPTASAIYDEQYARYRRTLSSDEFRDTTR